MRLRRFENTLAVFFLSSLMTALGLILFIFPGQVEAAYPEKPIEFIVNWAPGGSADLATRILGDALSKVVGQPVIVSNKGAGNGVVGTLSAAKAKPDGYTIYLSNSALFGTFYAIAKDLPYKLSDFSHICRVVTYPSVFVVKADSPWNTVADVIAYAKKNPGKVLYGSAGAGGTPHFVVELFKMETGLNLPHVPFKQGTEAATAIIGNHIQMGILNEAHVTNFVKSGQLKALAVTSPQRLSTYPQVPTMSEVGLPRCVIVGYYGISTAAGLPKPILDQLAEGFKKILADPPVAKNLVQNGIYPDYLGPEEYGRFVVEESKRYGEIAQKAKISLP